MEILETKVMRGPNYWSVEEHQIIVLKVRLDKAELSENGLDAISSSLSLLNLQVQRSVTEIAADELLGHLAAALQTRAGMDCKFLQSSPVEESGVFSVLFTYAVEAAGRYAAEAAMRIVRSSIIGVHYDIEDDLQRLENINRREALGPSTRALTSEAIRQNIPVTRLDEGSLIMLGHGRNQRIIRAAVANTTSAIAVEIVRDKDLTKNILAKGRIPTPQGLLAVSVADLEDAITALRYPVVVKPLNGNHGRGITTDIQNFEDAVKAFHVAQKISRSVIVERHIKGHDFRFLVINYQLVAVAKRTPAAVHGNGSSTIQELIDESNKDPRRGTGHENVLTKITVDDYTLKILAENNLTLDSVLPAGNTLYLKYTANISTGGTADDVTDLVHPQNKKMAERVARLTNLDICGIDIMAEDIAVPITKHNGAVIEVNAGPGLRMHVAPSNGTARNVAKPILDMLYTEGSRIPLIAITGTNGKTTTTRLIAHLGKQAGYCVGFTTTDGVFINDEVVDQGDCSGPASASLVLRDSLVNFAVLECARGGILRSGLGFDQCSISIVTNISEDHLGLNGVNSIQQLAKVKAVVPKSTAKTGHAILNADDDLVYAMKEDLVCNIALFSLNPDNDRIQQHLSNGGLAATIENGSFIICQGQQVHKVIPVAEVPLTFGGKAESMVKNVLPSILAAYIQGISFTDIQDALKGFVPSPENTPGRMNLFEFANFKFMVDYAHNEAGFKEMKKYAEEVIASRKTGIISAAGDRREQDLINQGSLAAGIFDNLIIKHNKNGRGRTGEDITELLLEGVRKVNRDLPVKIIVDEKEALQYAIDNVIKDEWIFVNTEEVQETLSFIAGAQKKDMLA
jgi:cyanophycin synthetase